MVVGFVWIAHGLPLDSEGPHYAVAGEVADRGAVLTCTVGDLLGDLSEKLDSVPHDYCVVLNQHNVVLGRMRKKNVVGRRTSPSRSSWSRDRPRYVLKNRPSHFWTG
jgi:hypothetical protein